MVIEKLKFDYIAFYLLELMGNAFLLFRSYFGVSRSATIVIAYIMNKYKLSYDAALQRVKSKRRFVMPNPGFINQLKLFSIMSYRIDSQNEKYKLFRLKLAADNVRKGKLGLVCGGAGFGFIILDGIEAN